MSRFGCILMLASVGIAAAQGSSVPSFGSVEVPSLGRSKPIPVSASPSSAPSSNQTLPPLGDPAAAPGACKSGPALEPREYTQPEVLGRPSGARARLCFYRQSSPGAVDLLQFYPSGHFVLTSQNGSGGFALSGSVLGTTRLKRCCAICKSVNHSSDHSSFAPENLALSRNTRPQSIQPYDGILHTFCA